MPFSTRRRPFPGAVALAAAAALLLATPAGAQFAGVPAPPPRRAAPAPPVAARPGLDSMSRLQRERDSLATVQRLDIQAWVDSAAPALARRPAVVDSARPATPQPPPKRPDGLSFVVPVVPRSGLAAPRRPSVDGVPASVADARRPLYLRPWPCQATYARLPSRSA